jgi:transcriptional regulator GlxA family with amidase domain
MNIGIYIYDGAEVLDFSGPFEVFSIAKRLGAKNWNVFLIAENSTPVSARADFKVIPHYSIKDHSNIDLLLIAGGIHEKEMNKPQVLNWIKTVDQYAQYVTSVCTGAFILANTDILDGKTATTHWDDINDLRTQFPKLNVVVDQRWVDSGKYITSGGISAGIEMSLYLVGQLHSKDLAFKVARIMDYRWQQ